MSNYRARNIGLFCIFIISVGLPFNANTANKKNKELTYQEVFYHFYRKDAFNAIVNYSAALQQKNLPDNLKRKQLLLGSMYFMYDMDNRAESVFLKVVRSNADREQKATAWYYLAKIYYQTSNFTNLNNALRKSTKYLPQSLKDEHSYIQGMYYLKLRDFDKAESILKTMNRQKFWYQMFEFNLGASYIKANMGDKGVGFIRDVGENDHSSEDMLALKDKSNIVLGYYFLRNKNSRDAIDVLENVRLSGPFSNKALLGLGWAYTEKQQFRKALIPWMALANKDAAQLTVQEAQLAVPFAFAQLNAENKSMSLYKKSIDSYQSVKDDIDYTLAIAKRSSIFSILLSDNVYDDFTISRKIIEHKGSVQGRVLNELLQRENFQQMFSTYRDLKQLQFKLGIWQAELQKMQMLLRSLPKNYQFSRNNENSKNSDEKNKRYYTEMVMTLADRVNLQNNRMNILVGMYESFVQKHVVDALDVKRQYIVTYLSQTRFAMAELLDKAQRLGQ